MAIANAVQHGMTVYVYNEKNQQIFTQSAGCGANDGLKGYTGSSVNIRRGTTIYTYNEKGQQTGTQSAR
jgi:predicted lipoprotein with Yx(FWY)xxD motif